MTQLQLGLERKRAGIKKVSAHNRHFHERMRIQALKICAEKGTVCIDDLREWGEQMGMRPQSPKAWGAIFAGNDWTAIARVTSRIKSNHARKVNVYIPRVGI